jgi:hypothetical protein
VQKFNMSQTPMLILLLFFVAMTLTAGGASPLETQNATVGPYQLLLSFYNLPRAGQAMNMTIESAQAGVNLQFSQAVLNPAPGTDGNTIGVTITPDSESRYVFDVNVTPPVRGKWLLRLMVTGADGSIVGTIPITVDGPPAIPTWLGWLIGLVPLPLLIGFLLWQVRWRKKQRARLQMGA